MSKLADLQFALSTQPPPPPPTGHGIAAGVGGSTNTVVYMTDGGPTQWGPRSQNALCKNCGQQMVTSVKYTAGLITWLLCGCCVLFGCWLCCCLPFCMSDCQNTEHYCAECKTYLGRYQRF
uniref:LITAF domain-containing protein n=1 Tax=Globodera rostochiensis TaxID=31243 RepID=A0A914I2Z7_GLORO